MRYFIILLIFSYTGAHADPFAINIVETYQGHTGQTALENIYIETYAPLGAIPKLVCYPSKRGMRLVNQEVLDAEAERFTA